MKVEIKTNEKGYCDVFKINDVELGQGVSAVDIHIECGNTFMKLDTKVDDLVLNGKRIEVYKNNNETKDN